MAIIDRIPQSSPAAEGVDVRPSVTGEYCCFMCGSRILACGPLLPDCAVCHQNAWRLVAWRPFSGPRDDHRPPGDPPQARP